VVVIIKHLLGLSAAVFLPLGAVVCLGVSAAAPMIVGRVSIRDIIDYFFRGPGGSAHAYDAPEPSPEPSPSRARAY
jgi:hypothetical protein